MDQLLEISQRVKLVEKQKSKKDAIINDLKAHISENKAVEEDREFYKKKL